MFTLYKKRAASGHPITAQEANAYWHLVVASYDPLDGSFHCSAPNETLARRNLILLKGSNQEHRMNSTHSLSTPTCKIMKL